VCQQRDSLPWCVSWECLRVVQESMGGVTDAKLALARRLGSSIWSESIMMQQWQRALLYGSDNLCFSSPQPDCWLLWLDYTPGWLWKRAGWPPSLDAGVVRPR
jgi:hypothetical protein